MNYYDCLDFSWLPAALVILFSGLLGGLAAYNFDKLGDSTKNHTDLLRVNGYLITGVAAAFTIPLFLHTASSHLLQDASKNNFLYFVLAGFCIVAAVFSRRFLKAIGYQALQIAERAAARTEQVAETTKHDVLRLRKIISPISKIESGMYKEAAKELEDIVFDDPENSEALSWLAYCYKRLTPPRLKEAVQVLQRALDLQDEKPFLWLYNLACYKATLGDATDEILLLLSNALAVATPSERSSLKEDLQSDPDFATLIERGDASFKEFLRKL